MWPGLLLLWPVCNYFPRPVFLILRCCAPVRPSCLQFSTVFTVFFTILPLPGMLLSLVITRPVLTHLSGVDSGMMLFRKPSLNTWVQPSAAWALLYVSTNLKIMCPLLGWCCEIPLDRTLVLFISEDLASDTGCFVDTQWMSVTDLVPDSHGSGHTFRSDPCQQVSFFSLCSPWSYDGVKWNRAWSLVLRWLTTSFQNIVPVLSTTKGDQPSGLLRV